MHFRCVDRLRGIAILAVIWHHFANRNFAYGDWLSEFGVAGFPAVWVRHGWMGVNLFFILSGFVLYLPYAEKRRSFDVAADVHAFCRHRAARLLPLYFLSTAILLVLNSSGVTANEMIVQVITLATFTFNFSSSTFYPRANWVLWSLGIEIWFTLAFILIACALRRFKLPQVALAVFCTALLVRSLGTYLLPGLDLVGPKVDPPVNPITNSFVGRVDDFFVGMMVAAWYARTDRRLPLSRGYTASMLALGVLLVTVSAILWDTYWAGFSVPKWQTIFANNVFQAGAALVLVVLLRNESGSAPTHGSFLLELAGLMCYSIYIWHGVIMMSIFGHGEKPLPMIGAYVAAIAAIGWLSYRYVEFGQVKDWRRLLPKAATTTP